MGLHLGIGLLISFSYILFMQFSTVFATNGNMNPLLAVWLPNILFAIIGLGVRRIVHLSGCASDNINIPFVPCLL